MVLNWYRPELFDMHIKISQILRSTKTCHAKILASRKKRDSDAVFLGITSYLNMHLKSSFIVCDYTKLTFKSLVKVRERAQGLKALSSRTSRLNP